MFVSAQDLTSTQRPEVPELPRPRGTTPALSGLDLQREPADVDPSIPIVFITAHGDIPMTLQAVNAGVVEFLTKPFRDQQLLDAGPEGD